jgi:iron(III) transport system substrate-binding protein
MATGICGKRALPKRSPLALRRCCLAIALAAAGCSPPPPPPVGPVRFYASPGLPGATVVDLARRSGIAEPIPVGRPEEAEVAWLTDPTEALALGDRAAPGSAPEQPRVPDDFLDPRRRFAPVGAIAQVIVASTRTPPRFVPDELRELADPRVRGSVAMTPLGRGDGPLLVAALELAYGARGTHGWLAQLAGNSPLLVETDAEAVARVAAGKAAVALVDSLTAGGELARSGLRVVFPDQEAKGCVTVPTALVVLPGASPSARKFSAWLAGPDAEEVLALRAPGLLPIRDGALAPDGMIPAWKLKTLTVKWGALAEGEESWSRRLAGWPARVPAGPP